MAKNPGYTIETSSMLSIPASLIKAELEGLYGANVLKDMGEILKLYEVYNGGAEYTAEGAMDYTPADLHYKTVRSLLSKEARFLFSKTPDVYVDIALGDDAAENAKAKDDMSVYQTLVDNVLNANQFPKALLAAAKDCFIGKRVAVLLNFNDKGVQLSFLPSLEFVYDVDPADVNTLTKIIAFYQLNTEKAKADQRIYKKKYWMDNDFCWYAEAIYDGLGNMVEEIAADTKTLFTYIPAWVITNDSLTGDMMGVSEVEQLMEYESWYSRLAAADMDAERKGMNPIRWARDMSPESTADLSISAGSFWDLSSDPNAADGIVGEVGVLDSPMSYSSALADTLNRIKNTMYEECAVPNVSSEALKGVVSSGKTLKAIYWDLIVRCDEKMLAWRPALQFMVRCIIEGVRLYPNSGAPYLTEALPDAEYTIRIDNQYPLPEDEQEEKQVDLGEVAAQTMSRKSYMKKWRNLTDDEADEELKQIALERELLEDSFGLTPPTDRRDQNTAQSAEETPQEEEETVPEADEETEEPEEV